MGCFELPQHLGKDALIVLDALGFVKDKKVKFELGELVLLSDDCLEGGHEHIEVVLPDEGLVALAFLVCTVEAEHS